MIIRWRICVTLLVYRWSQWRRTKFDHCVKFAAFKFWISNFARGTTNVPVLVAMSSMHLLFTKYIETLRTLVWLFSPFLLSFNFFIALAQSSNSRTDLTICGLSEDSSPNGVFLSLRLSLILGAKAFKNRQNDRGYACLRKTDKLMKSQIHNIYAEKSSTDTKLEQRRTTLTLA